MQKNFREHFGMFVGKIQNNEPFAFARYSDGELFILQNKVLKLASDVYQVGDSKHMSIYKNEDHKEFNPEIHNQFRERLIES